MAVPVGPETGVAATGFCYGSSQHCNGRPVLGRLAVCVAMERRVVCVAAVARHKKTDRAHGDTDMSEQTLPILRRLAAAGAIAAVAAFPLAACDEVDDDADNGEVEDVEDDDMDDDMDDEE